MSKVLKTVKSILFTIIGIVYFGFALFMTILLLNYNKYGVTEFEKKQLILIKEDLAINDYNKGDLVIVEKQNIDELKVGDKVFTYKVNSDRSVSIQYGVLGNIYPNDDSVAFENGTGYSMEFVAGKAVKSYPKYGTFLSIIESQWGFLFLVLVPIFLIFIYEVYALIIEIKYGAEKE